MKKYSYLITAFFILISIKMQAQCPNYIIVRNQEEVNDFPLLYPNCTELQGSLYIGSMSADSTIYNLDGLENITMISGNLFIKHNNEETDLELINLNYVGGHISIYYNEKSNIVLNSLLTVEGNVNIISNGFENIELNSLTSVGTSLPHGSFRFENNDSIQSIVLNNLSTFRGSLNLLRNYSLTNVAFNNIDSIENLWVIDNEALTNLDGFSGLVSINGKASIYGNNALDDLTGLSNLNSIGNSFELGSSALSTLNGLENLKSTGGYLSITEHENLVDLTALSNLTSIGGESLYIWNNTSLESLSGLDNIMSIGDSTLIYGNPNLSVCHVESICNYILENDGYYIADNASGCNNDVEIIENCFSVWEGYVQGKIYLDENTDCQQDPNELNLNDWLIKIEGEGIIEYAYPYGGGNYIQPLASGIYTVTALPPNSLWEDICTEQTSVQLSDQNPGANLDFGASTTTFCPFLEIDITTPIVRRCFDSNYYVRYCNSGTAIAEDAFVEVQLDPYFTFVDATIEEVNLGDNLYLFDLGDIGIGECGDFQIEVNVDCDSTVIGQTHCVEAHIFPDSICAPIDSLWDESSVMVNVECLGDSIEFTIENVGIGDMSDSLEYMVVEEDLIWHRANFQLDSGDNLKFSKPANGEYHRLESQQSPGHPGNSMPSVFVEGCGVDDNGEFSLGFVNYYLLDEGNAFVSIDCQENVGSYDPNDKQAFPVGIGDQHYITNDTDLEYMIRFQNTGTDTAFTVVIRDRISPHLNIETLRPGVSSHSYRYDIEGSNVAVFHFDNIMLPDSNVNEAASHGFIKFNIKQQANNAIGTVLENEASIYFDFNDPIVTNVVTHTIREDFFTNTVSIVTPIEVEEAGISVNVFPNPFDQYTIFEVQGGAVSKLYLSVYDVMGREVVQQQNTNQSFIALHRNNLPSGVYIFRLMDEKQQLATGKLVIE